MKTALKWSFGNSKLEKTGTVSFNLPAVDSCPQAGICASVCYATQGAYSWPAVRKAREFNFTLAKRDPAAFEAFLLADLARIKHRSIRIHDSGDFFCQVYLDSWFRAAAANPGKAFYCYTKSLHLDWDAKPDNFTVVQSVGGKLDHLINIDKPHSRIFATDEDRISAGYVDGNIDDGPAQRGEIRIGLVYHGVRNLTDHQKEVFK